MAFGADAVASTKQAQQFGILQKMEYLTPNISQFQGKELAAQIMGGSWYTSLVVDRGGHLSIGQALRSGFEKKNGYKPRWGASEVYLQMLVWVDAVECRRILFGRGDQAARGWTQS